MGGEKVDKLWCFCIIGLSWLRPLEADHPRGDSPPPEGTRACLALAALGYGHARLR